MVTKTTGIFDKIGTLFDAQLTDADPPVTIGNDVFGMAVAKKDMTKSAGDAMNMSFAQITLEGGPGDPTGSVGLQVSHP